MEYRILGPLEVLEDGRPLALGRLKERIVLAVLLLHANEFVSRERLIDELWGMAPPATANKAVNVYVSKLRKTLARDGSDPIATADGGYRLEVGAGLVDAERMRSLAAAAREQMAAGESGAASRLLQEALAFWRGPTLAGLALESFGRDEVAQLDEMRLAVLMDRIDCDLAQGRHEHVLGELQVLVREHPLRERLRAQQMLALYRADRQADALDAYRQARRDLIEELGIEPSESLQRLQQGILRHDPALELPAGIATANGAASAPVPGESGAPGPVRPRSRPRNAALTRRSVVVAAIVVVAAAAATAAAVLSTRGGAHAGARLDARGQVRPDSLVRLDPATGRVSWDLRAGSEPGSIALARNTLWVVQRGTGTIEHYDLRGVKLTAPFNAGSVPYAVAADRDGNAWVSGRSPVVNWILHTASGTGASAATLQTQPISLPLPGAGAEAVGGGYVWVIAGPPPLRTGDRVSRIDIRRRALAGTIPLRGQTTAIAYGDGSAWIGTYDSRDSTAWLAVVGPGSDRPELVRLERDDGAGPSAIAVGDGSIWALTSAGTLVRIDPETDRIVARVRMSAQQPTRLTVGAGAVWTVDHNGYSVSEVDPRTDTVVRTIPLGTYASIPCDIAATHHAVFVAVGDAYCDTVGH